uniref:RAPTOR1B n=1 Tax=Solanum tuberosum TaxID=4113 RepID=M1AV11_SOLTU
MALGDLTISQLSAVAEESADHEDGDRNNDGSFDVVSAENEMTMTTTATSMAYVPQFIWFRELRHDEFEAYVPTAPANTGLVSKWRIKDRLNRPPDNLRNSVPGLLSFPAQILPDEDGMCCPCFVFEHQCSSTRCNKGISLCSDAVLDWANRFWKSSHQPRGSKGFLMFYPQILCVCSSYKEDGEKVGQV